MKKIKLLLALVMVFSALCFGFRANAQTMVPARLMSGSNESVSWATTKWYVTLHNELTNEDIYLETTSYDVDSNGFHNMGDIPVGTYTVYASYSRSDFYEESFDYNINNSDWYLVHMYAYVDKLLATGVVVSYDPIYVDSGLNILIYTN